MRIGPEESAPYEVGRPGPPYAVFALAGLLVAVWFLRGMLAPLILAFVLAYALDPWVSSLERRGVHRRLAAGFVMSILVAALCALVFWGLPSLIDELRLLGANLPGRMADLEAFRRRYELASTLLTLRHKRGLTQQELARVSGVQQSEISRIESGRGNPTWQTMDQLATALGVQLGFVVPRKTVSAKGTTKAPAQNRKRK